MPIREASRPYETGAFDAMPDPLDANAREVAIDLLRRITGLPIWPATLAWKTASVRGSPRRATLFLIMMGLLSMGCPHREPGRPTAVAGQGRWSDEVGYWTSRDHQTFSYTVWLTASVNTFKAVVIAIHGLSGAAQDFHPLGVSLTSQGVITYAYALRGQGSDPVVSRRGDIKHSRLWFNDLADFTSLVRARHPGVPVFLYGESMGALIALHAAATPSAAAAISGLVLASPVVRVENTMSWWQRLLLRSFMRLAPTYRISLAPRRTPTPQLTRDDTHQQRLQQAPHTLKTLTLRLMRHIGYLMKQSDAAAARLSVPTLVLYAGNDAFVTPRAVEHFFDRIAATDKRKYFFPDSYHLLLHDDDDDDVLRHVKTWMSRRLSP